MSWRRFLRRRWWDGERAREIEGYLEIETADNIARGMTAREAAAAARRKFGNPVLVREEIYRMNSIGWIESIWQDVRYGARLLRMSPGFAVVAILSLALGIGANSAIFQLLNAVRLRSLPAPNAGELAEIRTTAGDPRMGIVTSRYAQLTRPVFNLIRTQQQGFTEVFAWSIGGLNTGKGSELRRVKALFASSEIFSVLGLRPWRGRLFLPEDELPCSALGPVVVSYPYWQSVMGGRDIASGGLMVNGALHDVIGVTPPGFFGVVVGQSFDIAMTYCTPKQFRGDLFETAAMGRLRPGWTLARASAQLNAISPGIFEAVAPTEYDQVMIRKFKAFRLAAYPGASGVSALRKAYDSALWLLLAITGLVLLIACANLANLLLARASSRSREIAVRLALGASRARVARQLIAESALLAGLGAVLGAGLAQVLSRVMVWSISTDTDTVQLSLEADWRVLLFTSAVAAATCVVFGVAPSLRATRIEPISAMKSGGRGLTAGRERFSAQRLMVVAEIALSLVLVVGALLFVRSFRNLMHFDPGMRESGVSVAFLGFGESKIPKERLDEFQEELIEEVRSIPGVLGAATTTNVPLTGGDWEHGIRIGSAEGSAKFTWVSPEYFATMGIALRRGRGLSKTDTAVSPRVAVVNEGFAREFLGGADPIGKTLRTGAEPNYPSTVYEIVGVLADTRYNDLRSATPAAVWAPSTQFPDKQSGIAMMIYSNAAPASTLASVRRKMAEKHPEIAIDGFDFQKRIRDGMVRERLMAMLSGFFGLLAALLATVGLYGVISYIVTRRRNEIGIRMALGAKPGQVTGMVMREAGVLLAAGVAIGTGLSLVAGRAAGSMLFELKASDPVTLGVACLLLGAIAAGASFIPARRAARLDPMNALRHE